VESRFDPLEGHIFAPPARQTPSPFSPQANAAVFFTLRIFTWRKIVVGPSCKGAVDLDAPVSDNLKSIAKRLDRDVEDLVSSCCDRPRHENSSRLFARPARAFVLSATRSLR